MTKRLSLTIHLCLALSAMAAPSAEAQSPAARPTPRIQGVSFVTAQYQLGGSISAFAARRVGTMMAVAGASENPRTGNRTAVVAAGTRVRFGTSSSLVVMLGGAAGSDGWSIRLYAVPHFARGSMSVSGTANFVLPLNSAGAHQVSANPITASVKVAGTVRTGVATVIQATEEKPLRVGAGPSVQFRVDRTLIAIEGIMRERGSVELRGRVSAAF